MITYKSNELVAGGLSSSSKGNQRKWLTRDGNWYVKGCFEYQGRTWRDDLVEVIATQYADGCAQQSCGVPVLVQLPCEVDGCPAVTSMNFCSPTQVFIPFQRLCNKIGFTMPNYLQQSPGVNFETLKLVYTFATGLDAHNYLLGMATLDAVVGNEDRHYNNFGVLYDSVSRSYSLPPLFDFGLGLFEHDAKYDGLSYKECIPLMQCKPLTVDNDVLIDFLVSEHSDFLRAFLPESVNVSEFTFPSDNAESYFRNRNIRLGVKLTC